MEHKFEGSYKNIKLVPLKHENLELLREWRNDVNDSKFLRHIGHITKEMQEKWYKDYLTDKDSYVFAIYEMEKLNRLIGSVSLYNFRGDIAEIGKIQIGDKEARGIGAGKITLVIACKIGFELMNLKIIDGHVHKDNIAAYKSDMAVGFKVIKESLTAEDYIQMTYEDLKKANSYVDEVEVTINE